MSCMKNDKGGCSSATVALVVVVKGLAAVGMVAAGPATGAMSGASGAGTMTGGSASSSVRIRAAWTHLRAMARSKRWSVALSALDVSKICFAI